MIFWIVVAMVGARSAAMAFNRLVDADLDARNPRTEVAAHPGRLAVARLRVGLRRSLLLVLMLAAWELNPLCFHLAPVALRVVFLYSFTKRFTVAFAPGAGIRAGDRAGRGLDCGPGIARSPHTVAHCRGHLLDRGFDIIYSCQDYEFDCDRACSACRAASVSAGALCVARALASADDRLPAGSGA